MSSSVGGDEHALVVAFLSAVGGIGRTSSVANLGWVLAGTDQRVLILDLGSEPPTIAEYLEPFYLDEISLADDVRRSLASLFRSSDGLAPAAVSRYQPPRSSGRVDVYSPRLPVARRAETGDGRWDPGVLSDLRSWLGDPRYDYVLIDAPTGSSPATLSMIGTAADVAAVCFRPRPGAIIDAAQLADQLVNTTPLRIDIVPVATMFDHRYSPKAERSLASIRKEFAGLRSHPASGPVDNQAIQIPYLPYEAFEPLLAVMAEEAQDPAGLRTQYELLASAVTRGAVTSIRPVPPLVRARYRRAFRLDPPGEPDTMLVAYTPADRVWADWARDVLHLVGVRTEPVRLGQDEGQNGGKDESVGSDAPELVVISSANLAGAGRGDELSRLVERYVADPEHRTAVLAVVDHQGGVELPGVGSMNLAGQAHGEAETRLLTRFGLIKPARQAADEPVRFPGDEPALFGVPPRHSGFVGRDGDLELLRDRIRRFGSDLAVIAITGGPGVGKSELAKEYAYRFAGDYDLVWWLPAHDDQSLLAGLGQLAEQTRTQDLLDIQFNEQHPGSLLAELAAGTRVRRWLVVLDNVEDVGSVRRMLPDHGRGHVLITTMDTARGGVDLANLSLDDGSSLLRKRMPDLPPDAGYAVAQAVDGLPLALELAGSWLAEAVEEERLTGSSSADAAAWAVRAFLELIDRQPGEHAVDRVVRSLMESLRDSPQGRLAVLLAEFCSFLSPQGVALHLVRSPALLAKLVKMGGHDATTLALDSSEIDQVLWIGTRYGLFQVYWGTESALRMHRVVRDVVRDGMSGTQRDLRQADLLAALAAYAPTEVEEQAPYRRLRFTELQKHVLFSGALGSTDDQVRRWIVNQLRFLYTDAGYGAGHGATELAHTLLADWTEKFGDEDPLRARLAAQLANIERLAGRPEVALELDDSALVVQRRVLDRTHPQALVSARGRAGDLRGLGLFAEALAEDAAVWESFTRSCGPDHPHTRSAANNLATSLSLSGDPEAALALEKDNFERRLRLFGPQDPQTWQSQVRMGIYQRELGRYPESTQLLRTALTRLGSLRETPPQEILLAADWHLSITERLHRDFRSAKDRSSRTLSRFREVLGPNHPYTLACTLSTAMDYRALNETAVAEEAARHVRDGLQEHVGLALAHPFVALARICLGLCLCACNDADEAMPEVSGGLESLRANLGDVHPWTVAAQVAEARVVAATGDLAQATELIRNAHETSAKFLGGRHPATRIAANDLAEVSRLDAEFDQGWRDIDVDIPQT